MDYYIWWTAKGHSGAGYYNENGLTVCLSKGNIILYD